MLIFTIFIGVVATTFLFVSRALGEANEVRKVYTEARVIMDRLTQDVRLNTVDYSGYACDAAAGYGAFNECTLLGQTGATTVLPLISRDGLHRIIYRFEAGSDGGEGGGGSFSALKLDWRDNAIGGGGQWVLADGFLPSVGFVPFQTESVTLENVAFVIAPLASSTSLLDRHQFQPSVHVVVEARSASSRLPESIPVSLSTTVSSRVYSLF